MLYMPIMLTACMFSYFRTPMMERYKYRTSLGTNFRGCRPKRSKAVQGTGAKDVEQPSMQTSAMLYEQFKRLLKTNLLERRTAARNFQACILACMLQFKRSLIVCPMLLYMQYRPVHGQIIGAVLYLTSGHARSIAKSEIYVITQLSTLMTENLGQGPHISQHRV